MCYELRNQNTNERNKHKYICANCFGPMPVRLGTRQKFCKTISTPPFEKKLEGRIQPLSSRRITGNMSNTNPFIVFWGIEETFQRTAATANVCSDIV